MLALSQPTIDMLTLSIRYGKEYTNKLEWDSHCQRLNQVFDRLCKIVEKDIGYPLQNLHNGKTYIPRYGIYMTQPSATWGYGRIYLKPTKWKLERLQEWLTQTFYNLNGIVSLHSIELAWDFHDHKLSLQDYEKLALRIGSRLLPKSIVNPFTLAIIGNSKRCSDGAVNGGLTVYVQSTERRGASQDASTLKHKTKTAGHTKVYAKSIAKTDFLRIEHRLDKGKANRNGIALDPTNFTKIMDLPNLPFSDFFQFKQLDLPTFIQALHPQSGLKGIRQRLWKNELESGPSMTTADAMRLIRVASRGSKELTAAAKRATKSMSFEEAINCPLPEDFYIAQRMGTHALPDDEELTRHIELAPFVHEAEGEPVKPVQGKLPLSQVVPQNEPELASTDTKSKSMGENMDSQQNAPSEAQEAEMIRTKWPDDGTFKMVDLPADARIVAISPDMAQNRPKPTDEEDL